MNFLFKSLSVRDFVDESDKWESDELIQNVKKHTIELEKLLTEMTQDSPYYGCILEIQHLIDFCKKLLYYNTYKTEPAGVSPEDFLSIKKILNRHNL